MCVPGSEIALAKMAFSAVTTVAGYIGQRNAAKEEERRQNEHYIRTANQANRAFVLETEQLRRRQTEEDIEKSNEIQAAQIETTKAKAAAQVSAAEAGVAGVSIEALLDDYDRALGVYRDGVRQSDEFADLQVSDDILASTYKRDGRIDSARPQGVNMPSPLGMVGDLAGAAFSYASATANPVDSGNSFGTSATDPYAFEDRRTHRR